MDVEDAISIWLQHRRRDETHIARQDDPADVMDTQLAQNLALARCFIWVHARIESVDGNTSLACERHCAAGWAVRDDECKPRPFSRRLGLLDETLEVRAVARGEDR